MGCFGFPSGVASHATPSPDMDTMFSCPALGNTFAVWVGTLGENREELGNVDLAEGWIGVWRRNRLTTEQF